MSVPEGHVLASVSHSCISRSLNISIVKYTDGLYTNEGGGPRVVVSTAAFHARVRGSVPGLSGLKETKLFLPQPRVKVSIVGSLRDREVACSASDLQGSNFESCVWRTVSSQSSHHPQEVLLAQFSLYVHKGGLKPDSFHFYKRMRMSFTQKIVKFYIQGFLLSPSTICACGQFHYKNVMRRVMPIGLCCFQIKYKKWCAAEWKNTDPLLCCCVQRQNAVSAHFTSKQILPFRLCTAVYTMSCIDAGH